MPDSRAAQADIRASTCRDISLGHTQLLAYALCIRDYAHLHRWMVRVREEGVVSTWALGRWLPKPEPRHLCPAAAAATATTGFPPLVLQPAAGVH